MNVFRQLTIRTLKLNRKRTIGTIIGIILSVSLICAVAGMATSFQRTLVDTTVNDTGYYHLSLTNISTQNLEELKNNRDIKTINSVYDIGYSFLEEVKNTDKPYAHVYSISTQEEFKNLSLKLIEGRFPTNQNEIVISQAMVKNEKLNYKIGDKILLEVGQRKTLANESLNKNDSYHSEEEKIVNAQTQEFTIVGIIQKPNSIFEGYEGTGYTVITSQMKSETLDAYLALKNPYEAKEAINSILNVKDYKSASMEEKYEYQVNNELLRWEGFQFSDETIQMFYIVIIVVMITIMLTSIYCIKNAFAISATEKTKMYGMLSSIGATKKQIKNSVILEGMILALIGIPLGIFFGILAVFILVALVNQLLGGTAIWGNEISFYISVWPVLISILLGFITIYLSVIATARKTSKITPMEAIRNTNEIKIGNKELKTPKIIHKLLGVGGVIAYKNLKRSKKKYRTTVVSLVMSAFVFITMSSLLTYGFKSTAEYYKDYDFNMKFTTSVGNAKLLNSIVKNEELQDYTMVYENYYPGNHYFTVKDLSKVTQAGKETNQPSTINQETGEFTYGEIEEAKIELKALDEASFKKYVEKLKLNFETVKKQGILCDYMQVYNEGNLTEERAYNYQKGDTISGRFQEKQLEVQVAAVSEIKPRGLENVGYNGGFLIVNLAEYENLNLVPDVLTAQVEKPDELEATILKNYPDISVSNISKDVEQQKTMILVISIFAYGFITVITLIGVTNIFNTITSNIELRQKEFATLKSIGMTKKEFNHMINLETIFYCSKALLWGILLGLLGTFGLYKAFYTKFQYEFIIPTSAILLSIVFVFALVFIIMRFSMKKINKQNTIETIRKEMI